jgi:hypothetical protein
VVEIDRIHPNVRVSYGADRWPRQTKLETPFVTHHELIVVEALVRSAERRIFVDSVALATGF